MIEKANGSASDHGELNSSAISPANLAFAEDLYQQFVTDPQSVEPAWRSYFESLENGAGRSSSSAKAPTDFSRSIFSSAPGTSSNGHGTSVAMAAKPPGRLQSERAQRLVEAYRELGHLSADLDPLGLTKRAGAPLDLEFYGLSAADMDQVFSSETVAGPDRTTLRGLVELLRETYTRHIGVELAHLHDVDLRTWLLNRMESTRNRLDLTHEERWRLLEKVTEAEVFEQFLHKKFLGAKRFSLEGAESLIPLLDRLIERAARSNVSEIVIGMAHRGRLNVLANILEKPAAKIFAEFMDKHGEDTSRGGDVKYHLGHSHDRVFGSGSDAHRVHLSLTFNPSHLEWVNTVVQGRVRAKQDRLNDTDRTRCLPLLIHGDAAFAGQGIVAEAFNLSELEGYRVGGTVHIVVNNQIGFTTSPRNGYSTTYATDVARMLQIPIFHVNGEDPEAVSQVVDLALDFRQRFHRDALIEVWCYRKYGHNEGDEPAFTQPIMYRRIAEKPSIRMAFVQAFAERPPTDGSRGITAEDADTLAVNRRQKLELELEKADNMEIPAPSNTFSGAWAKVRGGADNTVPQVPTAVSAQTVQSIGRILTEVPPGFTMHPKLKDIVDGRGEMALGTKPINWGMGEALALGTLLQDGVRIRFSGQDVRRGTFSHRHSVYVDFETGREYTPLAQIRNKQGSFEIRDSPLSEAGVLGFDYGYSLDMPDGLTIWEAQFGDFVNGAQVIIDQFLVSSEAKWNRVSGLVLLLPHGMEGQGPEHSSARLERFLTLAVNDNIQVCNLTTPAQYFHVMRRQVLRPYRKPLIIMTPKSLLRHPVATSQLSDFTQGKFQHIIPDEAIKDWSKVKRVLLCTGKVYYELVATREEYGFDDVALVRIEQLYPLQKEELLEMLSPVPEGTPVIWVQEEPRNMGGWVYMNRELPGLLSGSFPWSCVSRPLSASPAVGSLARHKREQARLMADAFGRGAL